MKYYKFETYVPSAHTEKVRNALAAAGAGRLGAYDHCIWETAGTGHFRPLAGSHPFLGKRDVIENIPEVKLETLCSEADLAAVIAALKTAHPYEVPAFYCWPIELEKLP